MKVLHTINGLAAKSGGPTTCTYSLLKGLNKEENNVDVLTYEPVNNDILIGSDSFIKVVPRPKDTRLAYSPVFKNYLSNHNHYDLYHINAIWQYPAHATAKYARINKKPYIISPHGMLYANALKKSWFVKKVFYYAWFRKDLERAACIHATSKEEMRQIRNCGLKNPIAVIPNPIDLPVKSELDVNTSPLDRDSVIFIGRLVAIKGIDKLIRAWALIEKDNVKSKLLIAGDGDQREYLQNLVLNLGLKNVEFLGFLNNDGKVELYKRAKYLILPSESENFGMVVTEALSNKIPVIASKGTPWETLIEYKCGWWVDNSVETLAEALKEALIVSEEDRIKMGDNGKQLVLENYTSDVVSRKMNELYSWILNRGEKPEFVYL